VPGFGGFGGTAGGTGRVRPFGGFAGRGGGGPGGLISGSTPSKSVTEALKAGAAHYTWLAATIGSEDASGYQLATGDAVMPIGGFNGTDPSPTLAGFEADVRAARIHYFIPGGFGALGGRAGDDVAGQITRWVEANFTLTNVGGLPVYNLAAPGTPTPAG
jgi:hypothetical protein